MKKLRKSLAVILSLLLILTVFPLVNVGIKAEAASVSNWVTCTNCSSYRTTVNLIINGVSEGTNNYVDGTYEANISQYQVSSPVYLKSSLRPNSATIYVDRSVYSSLDQLGINVQLGSFSIHSNTGEVRWGIQIFGGHSGSPRTYLGSGAEYASSNGYNYYIYQSNPSHSGILSAETGDGNLNTNASTSSRTDLTFGPYNWYLRGDAPAVGAAAYIDVAGVCVVTAGSGNYQMLTEWTHLSIVGTCSHSAGSHVGANYNGTHSYYCNTCGANVGTYSCSGGAATCTAQAVCTTCGAAYGSSLGHASNGTWMNDNGDVHYTYCTRCGNWLTSGAHTSNGSWMSDWADGHYTYCTACGRWLSSDVHHSNNAWVAADGNTHYTYCVDCGRWLSSGSHTFAWRNNGDGTHSYYCTACGYVASTAAHSGGAATCTASPVCTTCGASYGSANGHSSNGTWMGDNADVHYKYCTVCHEWLESGAHRSNGSWVAVDGSTHRMYCPDCGRTVNTGNHTMAYKNNSDGTHSYYCRDCGYVASTTEHSDGTATCTAQAVCSSCNASYGELLPHSFTVLQSDANNHWYKCANCDATDGTDAHAGGTATCTTQAKCSTCDTSYGALLSHSYTGDVKNNDDGTHSFMCVNGCNEYGGTVNCTFGEWTTTTAPGCTTEGTKEHTCTACGYKETAAIDAEGHAYGDLIPEVPATCIKEGVKAHYTCSVCSRNFDADKNELDSLVIAVNEDNHVGETYTKEENIVDATCAATGSYDLVTYCSDCDAELSREAKEIAIDPDNHTGETYTKDENIVDATCIAKGSYDLVTYCSDCDAELSREAKEIAIDPDNHTGETYTKDEDIVDATCAAKGSYNLVTYCSGCDAKLDTEAIEIPVDPDNHTGETYTKDENIVDATCAATGSYDLVTYCKGCDEKLGSEEKEIAIDPDNHTGETYTKDENIVAATCIAKGSYDLVTYCKGCDAKLGSEAKELAVDPENHTGETYTQNENTVAATCAVKGSYDLVTYCSDCNAELSREAKEIDIDPENHTGETYTKDENTVAATCITKGSYDLVTYCKGCDTELNREAKEIAIDPANHTGATYTKDENVVAATCVTKGSYDLVTYCMGCDAKLSTEAKEIAIDPAAHTGTNHTEKAKAATCTEKGYTGDTVCECGVTLKNGEEIALKPHNIEAISVIAPTCVEDGKTVYGCKNCDYTYDVEHPATGHTAGAAIRENIVYDSHGKVKEYDSVVYCTVCGEKLSGPDHVIPDYECPACEMKDIAAQFNGNIFGKFILLAHDIFHAIFKLFDSVIG